jgi:hypothetical protein
VALARRFPKAAALDHSHKVLELLKLHDGSPFRRRRR